VERVLLHLAAGRPQLGLAELERRRADMDDHVLAPVIEERLLAAEARSLLAIGEVGRAEALLAPTPMGRAPELASARVQVALAASGPAAAEAAIDRWPADEGQPRGRLERTLWLALVDLDSGHRRRALQRAGRVLDVAQEEGHVRLFLDAGPGGERLVRALATQRPGPYLNRLVRAAGLLRPNGGPGPSGLSERELEIVRYLPTSLSNAEIATALYVSLNTLKTHLRTIYRKLGVRGRDEAIERAEALGIA
jgi:LuxR family maltose regulon positive regulatory protein